MSIRTAGALFLLLSVSSMSFAQKPGSEQELRVRIESARSELQKQQKALERATEERWAKRQTQVEAKERNKENADQIRQEIDRFYAEIARAREEMLARNQVLDREKDMLKQKEDELRFLSDAVNQKREDESKRNLVSFPIDQDKRMAAISAIEDKFPGNTQTIPKLIALFGYKENKITEGSRISAGRHTFILDEKDAITAQVVRIGYAMAYGMGPDNGTYFLGNTGQSGTEAFEWSRINNPKLSAKLTSDFPQWLSYGAIDGPVLMDIAQNRYSGSLIGSEKKSVSSKFMKLTKEGGIIMFPLFGIVFWALFLVWDRFKAYSIQRKSDHALINSSIALLEQGRTQEVYASVKQKGDILSVMLKTSLEQMQSSRESAEKRVSEILLDEAPKLDKHLDTLAALSAAAPLLGLLGTVTGMIGLFQTITQFGTGDPKLMAGGISEALITTQVGLYIAIPILLCHNYLRNRRNDIQADMETYAMKFLNRLWVEQPHQEQVV